MEMPKGKSPGPDRFTIEIFHERWQIIQQDAWKLIKNSHRNSFVLPTLNVTFLTLIPKEENVEYPSNFIIISLCNVVYKIITEVIENRMKPL
jgi:hypothetical protein